MRYKQIKDGEWIQPIRKNYRIQCCDCGLTHKLNFKLVKDKLGRATILFQAFRMDKKRKKP
jgi:hypothetical protein